MRDADVRVVLHEWLRREHQDELPSTRILDELDIAGHVRVDTVVLNGSFSGFEIKSATDTLRRLPRQVEVYSQVLDYATLVVANNHATKARVLLPSWWGVIEATSSADGVQLRSVRKARRNKVVDPFTLCTLLWRDEALAELELRDAAKGVRSKPNWVLWDRLARVADGETLREAVRERLKARSAWRSGEPLPRGV